MHPIQKSNQLQPTILRLPGLLRPDYSGRSLMESNFGHPCLYRVYLAGDLVLLRAVVAILVVEHLDDVHPFPVDHPQGREALPVEAQGYPLD